MRAIATLAGMVLIALAPILASTPAGAAHPFGAYSEIALRSGQAIPKWQAIRRPLAEQAAAVRECLETGACSSPAAVEIARKLAGLAALQPLEQAEAVHRLMNARPYKDDLRQFASSDVWQTPLAFWRQGGDCEDYALAKYLALRVLGFSEAELRLTILTSRARREVHAVLLVAVGGDWYVADNLKRGLRRADRYDGWKPEYSVSDAGAWRYVARSASTLAAAADEPAATKLPEPAGSAVASDRRTLASTPVRARF